MMSISPLNSGDMAAHFTLLDQQGQAHSLQDYLGQKVLVYFYPKALTPGCTTQACDLREHKSEFDDLKIQILGISPDLPAKLFNFTQKKALNFTLLSDPEHNVAQAFGVWGEKKFMGKVYEGLHRISFLIDEEGKICQVFTKFKTKEHANLVLTYLKNASRAEKS